MNKIIRRLLPALLASAMAWGAPHSAQAQPYPSRPLRVIVPIAPGSVTDVILRAASPELSQRLGQPVVIENRAGANGIVGAQACAAAAPDGYTLCAVYHATMSFNPLQFDRLPYDPASFVPVTNLFLLTEVLVASSATPARSVEELRRLATTQPLTFGTLGGGSLQELLVSWLNNQWGANITGIPYRGGGPIALAVAANEIQLGNMGVGNFLGGIQAGTVRPLAVTTTRRSPLLPETPTFGEAGLGGFPSRGWWGLVAPAGTPAEAVNRINAEVNRLFRDPAFADFLGRQGVQPQPGTPAEFAAFMAEDRAGAEALIRLSNQPRTEYRPSP
ncbi:Bug family tripartite tricarboxylate transporter substrate binding protein [Roseomonas populi]|uniref:Tripartite tricarboxylate transporter substrate binding protein n=1 Tax=Roseomonas populi TaxID=3121582 RepID=A0ABT1X5G1_9PROT|nr:tripartite tricarboxylate transporter substrate binding protein [Roseomonas pecuniae]MCR0983340.1 tripartite tricarboxylate transporter substrate binding protein [Roseomonas pecuniae]